MACAQMRTCPSEPGMNGPAAALSSSDAWRTMKWNRFRATSLAKSAFAFSFEPSFCCSSPARRQSNCACRVVMRIRWSEGTSWSHSCAITTSGDVLPHSSSPRGSRAMPSLMAPGCVSAVASPGSGTGHCTTQTVSKAVQLYDQFPFHRSLTQDEAAPAPASTSRLQREHIRRVVGHNIAAKRPAAIAHCYVQPKPILRCKRRCQEECHLH